jgi:hypothetical protein
MTDIELRIRIVQSLAGVPAEAWDACAGYDPARGGGPIAPTVKLTHEDNLPPQL